MLDTQRLGSMMSISMGLFNSSDSHYQVNEARSDSSVVMYPCSPMDPTGSCDRQTNLQPMYSLKPISTRLSARDKLLVDFPNDGDEYMDCDENEHFDRLRTDQKTHGVSKGYEGEKFSISKHSIPNTLVKCVQMDSYLYDSDDEDILLNEPVREVSSHSVSRTEHIRHVGELERMQELSQKYNTAEFPGGKDAKPLVGGFAAAAYEAAREHHYFGIKDDDNRQRKTERPPFPSI